MNGSEDRDLVEGAVVVSCDSLPCEDIIRQIISEEILPEGVTVDKWPCGYPWEFETKYYSACIRLYPLHSKSLYDADFSGSIRATLLYFDAKKASSFEAVQSWMPFMEGYDAEVQLLVCDHFDADANNSDLGKEKVLEWCVSNHFELVELHPTEESDDEEETEYRNLKGYARVRQALQSHTWANLIMKEDPSKRWMDKFSLENPGSLEAGVANLALGESTVPQDAEPLKDLDSALEDEMLHIVGEDDPNGESFEALFAKFAHLKEKAESLSGEERKRYAEKVAIAFWRAMGGDEEEIAGLDDEE